MLPNYRLAPEYPFPTGFKDCHESFLWVSFFYDVPPLDAVPLIIILPPGRYGTTLRSSVEILQS